MKMFTLNSALIATSKMLSDFGNQFSRMEELDRGTFIASNSWSHFVSRIHEIVVKDFSSVEDYHRTTRSFFIDFANYIDRIKSIVTEQRWRNLDENPRATFLTVVDMLSTKLPRS